MSTTRKTYYFSTLIKHDTKFLFCDEKKKKKSKGNLVKKPH